jgi:hypothetical protein
MRMMLTATFPVEAANAAIADGRFATTIQKTMERIKPEAAYFTATDGRRSATIVFDLAAPSDIPSICEPLFVEFNATIQIVPAMTADDVAAGLAKANAG